MSKSEWLDHVEGMSSSFMVASDEGLAEGSGHGGPGVCLSDGQTEAVEVPSKSVRGDALYRRSLPYVT